MRIGIFATWLNPVRGGIENLCWNLDGALREGNEVVCFSLDVPQEFKRDEGVYYAGTSKRTVPLWFYLKSWWRENQRKPFDANIAVHWGPGLCALAVKKLKGTPYVVYIMGKEMDYFPTPLHRLLVRLVLKNAKSVIAISEYTRGLADWVKGASFALVHPGVDDRLLEQPGETEVWQEQTPLRLFTVTRLVRRKGVHNVIQAVALLRDMDVDVEYRIAGGGEMQQELAAQIERLGLEDRVHLLGRITEREKAQQLQWAHLFAMPSYEIAEEREIEGFGIVYLEANSQGKFVIAGRSGGIPDAVQEGKTGFLVDGAKPEEIRDAILAYMRMPGEQKRTCAQACRQWAEAHGWKNIVKQVEALL